MAKYGCGKRILDFGCGEGIFSIQPARDGATVIGIDISPGSLAVARRRAELEQVNTHTLFCLGDCERLPFPDRSFDLVMSCGTLSCLDLRRGVSEMARVLRPDGRAIIVDTLGHNVLLNLRRRWETWRGNRTNWTREHILKLPDLQFFEEHFGHCAVRPFDLSTLALAFFSRRGTWLLDTASSVDRWVLGHPALKKLAFKVVVEASAPKRHNLDCPIFSVADAGP
jgi:SAM-dependent methyltransferase